MEGKLISVLTTTRNVENTVEETLKSIHSQTFTNFEHLLKDAVSTDNTIPVIQRYAEKLAYFESSPDKGIYDGLNLLATKAQGEWCIVIHAGDLFYSPEVLAQVAPYLTKDVDVVYGSVINIHETGVIQTKLPKSEAKLWKGMIGSHQAMFIRTELLRTFPYDLSWRVTADYDFLWKCIRSGARFKMIDTIVATVSGTGLSSKRILSNYKEKSRIALIYDTNPIHRLYWDFQILSLKIRQILKNFLPINLIRAFIQWKSSK